MPKAEQVHLVLRLERLGQLGTQRPVHHARGVLVVAEQVRGEEQVELAHAGVRAVVAVERAEGDAVEQGLLAAERAPEGLDHDLAVAALAHLLPELLHHDVREVARVAGIGIAQLHLRARRPGQADLGDDGRRADGLECLSSLHSEPLTLQDRTGWEGTW
jgi:hypothetical protein